MVPFNLPELSLDLSPPVTSTYLPEFLTRFPVTGNGNFAELTKLNEFINRLEDELGKIQAFKRELPLSFLLLNDAIDKLKEEARKRKERRKESKLDESVGAKLGNDSIEKKNWMSSAQLWSLSKEDDDRSRESQPCKYSGERGVFSSFMEDSRFSFKEEDAEPGLSLVTPGLKAPTAVEPGSEILPGSVFCSAAQPQIKPPFNQTARKQRRCWSPELHRRFVDALERLGGSQVATPKQIRELMQVEGLTNDEVKSHLQKYRLHVRKVPSSKAANHPSSPSNTVSMGEDQLELGCSILEAPSSSGSPESPLHLARSKKCNSGSMEEEEDEKSDGQSWKAQRHM